MSVTEAELSWVKLPVKTQDLKLVINNKHNTGGVRWCQSEPGELCNDSPLHNVTFNYDHHSPIINPIQTQPTDF